jgi:hypothetical protein
MKATTLEPDSVQPERRHTAAAVVAVLLSFGIHALLLWRMPHAEMLGPRVLPEAADDPAWIEPTQLFEIMRTPADSRPAAAADAIALPAAPDWTRTLDALAPAPETTDATATPAIDDTWLEDGGKPLNTPQSTPAADTWQPRQEIVAIERKTVRDEEAAIPRQTIARIERVGAAPDFAPPFDRTRAGAGLSGGGRGGSLPPAAIQRGPVAQPEPSRAAETALPDPVREKEEEIERADDRQTAERFKALEHGLRAKIETYADRRNREHRYFRITVDRADDEALPVIPKDIVYLQDCSNSMTEQILGFCRVGLSNSVARLDARDRFNVVKLRHTIDPCFPAPVPATPENIRRAQTFIAAMRAEGGTDIYRALQALLEIERVPGRPLVAVLISDGLPTAGVTQSADVIGKFTRVNDGAVSVYAVGTTRRANAYLLDLLSYSNRGEAQIVTRGRWDIPEALTALTAGVGRPHLCDIRFLFSESANVEVFPVQTTHLYQDRPLVLYGRAPRETQSVVFQAVGKALDTECDMIFTLPLTTANATGDRDIPRLWAEQKIYRIMALYARRRDPDLLRALRETARDYRIAVPYRH